MTGFLLDEDDWAEEGPARLFAVILANAALPLQQFRSTEGIPLTVQGNAGLIAGKPDQQPRCAVDEKGRDPWAQAQDRHPDGKTDPSEERPCFSCP